MILIVIVIEKMAEEWWFLAVGGGLSPDWGEAQGAPSAPYAFSPLQRAGKL
ncbi:MAG: hypothetical protein F7B06_11210 [Opitutae bacterium]|nr:hypothetical protein [Opitutae bacterium]